MKRLIVRVPTIALVLSVLLATSGCVAFMDGFCEKGNKPGGYCERYNAHRAQQTYSAPQPVAAPDPFGCAMLYAAGNQQGMMAAGCPPPFYGGYR